MIVRGADLGADEHVSADVVVVGTGAGGAVVAAELAAAGADVVLLEEGPYRRGAEFTARPLEQIRMLYRGLGMTGAIGNCFLPIPLGRCVGGTTTINSGTCFRALEPALRRWETEFGLAGLAAALAPGYERVEKALQVAPVPEGLLGRCDERVRSACERLGWRGSVIPRNAAGCRGTGVCALGCPRDAKQATHVSYVPRALERGARLVTGARVERILVDRPENVAWGVLASLVDDAGRPTGRRLRVLAGRVVLAAGALATPGLLLRSGVRARHLGRHLHVHPAVRVLARFDERIAAWEGVPQAWHVHEFEAEGIFLQGQFVPPALHAPNLPGFGSEHKQRMARYAEMGSFGALVSDRSEGRVLGNGTVLYWMRRGDVGRMRRAVGLTARLLFAAGAREVYPGVRTHPVLRSPPEAESLLEARVRASDLEMMAFHPMGTARMAADPARGAVGPDGAVFGCRNLHVADASLLPSSCGVNPQLTIMALATRVADALAVSG
jgi:choline dehydrogenase-like flavoprotein